MFKNALIYTAEFPQSITATDVDTAFKQQPFAHCGPSQEKSGGWLPPRGEANGPLLESIAGHWIAKYAIETKSIPGEVIKRHVDEKIAKIEQEQGRKPGRKECRELRDDIAHELLPHAFPKTVAVLVWFDRAKGRVVLDTTTKSRADHVITEIVRAIDGIIIAPFNTQVAPQAAMVQWLTDADGWPEPFSPGRQVELHSGDEMKSVVKFDRHHLDDEQMRLHISQGKLPTKLALDWDGRVSFILTEGTQLKKISFLDGVFEDNASAEDNGGFDADVAIATGELGALVTDLETALGGPLDRQHAGITSTETP